MIITPFTAFAAVMTYSDVMDDLQEDSGFDVTKYPLMSYDHFSALNSDEDTTNDVEYLSVIHIAESKDKELFIYTYQPLNNVSDITATSVNLSIGEGAVNYEKYTLKCVSFEGPFKKYLVEGFTIPSDFYRYYNISEIERPFDTLLDEKISNETITDYKAHKVAQTWCCYYENNELKYEMVTLDVVEITPTLTGFLYCKDGITWGSLVGISSQCNSHFIAFNVENYDVDKIVDATLVYKKRSYQKYSIQYYLLGFENGDPKVSTSYPNGNVYQEVRVELSHTDTVEHEGKGLWAKDYSWNRIMTAQDFVTNYETQDGELNGTAKETLLQSEFVFAFAETGFASWTTDSWSDTTPPMLNSRTTVEEGTEVAKVDILRLKFESEGETYNLGVVGDTTSGDNIADGGINGLDIDFDFNTGFEKIMAVVLLILLIVVITNVFFPIARPIFKIIYKGIGALISVAFSILTFPLRLILKRKRK